MFALTSSQAIVVKGGCSDVHVINEVSGAIIHSISTGWMNDAYPAVYQDDSVIIAWVQERSGSAEHRSVHKRAQMHQKHPH